MPVERAVDIIDVVQSAPTFNAFVVARGWLVAEFKAWSFTVLTQQLMPLPTAAATSAANTVAVAGLTFEELIERDGWAAAEYQGGHHDHVHEDPTR